MVYAYNEQFMRRAIELSEYAAIIKKQEEFSAQLSFIVKGDQVIAEGYNQVMAHNDPI